MWRDRRATLAELERVGAERDQQERLVLTGKFSRTCADPDAPDAERFAVLGEEQGEVAKAWLEHGPTSRELRDELIQVAAVAVAWAEAITAAVSPVSPAPPPPPQSARHKPSGAGSETP